MYIYALAGAYEAIFAPKVFALTRRDDPPFFCEISSRRRVDLENQGFFGIQLINYTQYLLIFPLSSAEAKQIATHTSLLYFLIVGVQKLTAPSHVSHYSPQRPLLFQAREMGK